MALTISDIGNGTSTTNNASVATGSTVTASVGDWLVAIVAADNAGTNGAASLTSVTDSASNTWTQRALINQDPGTANAGATLGIFVCEGVTNALSSGTVTANFSPNTTSKVIQVYRVQPGAGESVQFIAADGTGSTGSTATHSAATVSVTNGDTIFGAAAIETNTAVTGDSDTTNGNWSSVITRLANLAATDLASMTGSSQYKTVNATGNQSWACTTGAAKDSARSYLVIGPLATAKSIVIGAASYAFTPAAVTFRRGQRFVVDAASYAHTPTAVTFRHAWKFTVGAASYSFSPQAVSPLHKWKTTIGAASYTFSPQAVTLRRNLPLVVGAASYAFTPTAVTLKHGWKIAVGAASYSFTPQAVTFRHAWKVQIGAASYSFTPQDVTFQTASQKTIAIGAASYAFSPQAVTLRHAWKFDVGAASYSFGPQDVTLKHGHKVTVDPVSYSFSASDVTFTTGIVPPVIVHRPAAWDHRDLAKEAEEDRRRAIDLAWRIANGEIDPVTLQEIPEPTPVDLTAINEALTAHAQALDQLRIDAFISAEQQRLEEEAMVVLLTA